MIDKEREREREREDGDDGDGEGGGGLALGGVRGGRRGEPEASLLLRFYATSLFLPYYICPLSSVCPFHPRYP
jgi:hypothetical protein